MTEQTEAVTDESITSRPKFLPDSEISDLESTIRDTIAEHREEGGIFASDGYGVLAVYDGEDRVYAPIINQGADIIGAMVIGHITAGDIASTACAVWNLLPLEVDALEFGWFAVQNPAIMKSPEIHTLDSRMIAIGLKLGREFLS